MKINLALEWFLNPDHLPFIVGIKNGYYQKAGIELNIIRPNEHYDGFNALKKGEIEMALNEPLHLIEQFDPNMLSLGCFFETRGGVLLSLEGEKKLLKGEKIKISSPVSNEITNKIALEILSRYCANMNFVLNEKNISIEEVDFYHVKNIKNGYDGAWLAFSNFEGVEASMEGIGYVLVDSDLGRFPNFSALDIFTTKSFYDANGETVQKFLEVTRESMVAIRLDKGSAIKSYYEFAGEEPTPLMDKILEATISCFDEFFESEAGRHRGTLEFFKEIGITKLDYEEYKKAFLGE